MFSVFYIAKNKSIITGMDLQELLTANLHAVLQKSSDIVEPLCFHGFTKICCQDSPVKMFIGSNIQMSHQTPWQHIQT